MSSGGEDVYCTLLMSDTYLPGAAVLAKSLRDAGTKKKLAVLVTLDSLLYSTITELKDLYDYVLPVDRITNPNLENLARLDRLDLRFAFTKIGLWRQVQFRKIIYVDADVVALRAPDELFDIQSSFAAAPDIGWPDIFNSGVMVLTPSMSEYWSLHTLASSGTSFDGADQGLLNEYFGNRPWHRLSFAYNCTPSSSYQYEPAYRHFRSTISMVHFIGKDKPWMQGREALERGAAGGVYRELLGKWWSTYDRHYRVAPSSAIGQPVPGLRAVQQYVKGEQTQSASGWAASGQLPGHQPPPPTPAGGSRTPEGVDAPLLEPADRVESIGQGHIEPMPTAQQRKFFMDWDATRHENAPTPSARPEAMDFPSTKYEMSTNTSLFRPPQYHAPPSDMPYSMPMTASAPQERPRPIFPWESNATPPSRVFADDPPPQPETRPAPQETPIPPTATRPSPPTPTITVSPSEPVDPWASFKRKNAWDEVASIDEYVRKMKQAQAAKTGKVQVLQHSPSIPSSPNVAEQDFGAASSITSSSRQKRRESLILTDFPTADDRPSLPVTPAPIARQSFWGSERDAQGNLPAASGVPEQADWDPRQRLEDLRRSSITATENLPPRITQQSSAPQREIPSSSVPSSTASPVPHRDQEQQDEPASAARGTTNLFQETDLSGAKTPPMEKEEEKETVGPKDEYAIA